MDGRSLENEDPRLAKAAEVFEYLRAHPHETTKDAEDLAIQLEVDPQLVDRLLQTRVISERRLRLPRFSLKKLFAEVGKVVSRAVLGVTVQPYGFLLVAALLYVITGAFSVVGVKIHGGQATISVDSGPGAVGGVLFIAAQLLCLFVRPRFRHLVAAMLFSGVAFSLVVMSSIPAAQRPLWGLIGFFAGVAILGLLGLAAVLFGAGLQIGAARKKEAHLSRQQLITRMFELEAMLSGAPPAKPKRPRVVLRRIRANLFIWSLLVASAFAIGGLAGDLSAFAPGASAADKTQGAAVEQALRILWTVFTCFFAYIAGNLKKGAQLVLALAIGGLLPYLVFAAIQHSPAMTYQDVFLRVGRDTLGRAGLIALVLYVGFVQRELGRLRLEGAPNQTSIIADLMDVRHRLALASVLVYVMAVDVVRSTKMKEGADPLLAEFSFRGFQNWLAEKAGCHKGKVDAITGDGAIIAFGTGQGALECAIDVQRTVDEFNETKNRLKTPFRLRISLHAGLVVGELDEVQFTEVIDVAAHVEKLSPIGGFAATLDYLKELAHPLDGVEQGPVMDGKQIYLCQPALLSDYQDVKA